MGIIVRDINQKYDCEICLALGYFDSVHIGHLSLIDVCTTSSFTPAVFTFCNSPYGLLGGVDELVFTFGERLQRLEQLAVKLCISAEFTKDFMSITAQDFLDKLIANFKVKQAVIGQDYTCGGDGGKFRAEDVKQYLEDRNIHCTIMPLLNSKYGKVSSSAIKTLIKLGDIEAINSLLPMRYSVSGKVEHGRKDGSKLLGFPTANISFHKDKLLLKEGVYYTKIAINGTVYKAITNVGNHPTFDDYNYNIESFILDFHDSIYDEYINVEFISRLRDTIKFESVDGLIAQISRDVRRVKQWQ